MTSETIEVRGVELAYSATGDGRPFIYGHGLSQSRAGDDRMGLIEWSKFDAPVRLIRYDARGHGQSGSTAEREGYSWAELAQDQLELADGLDVASYIAGGASMGCGTALHAAVMAPERVTALVLLIPPTAWETRQGQSAMWDKVAGIIEAKGVERVIEGSAKLPSPDPFAGSTRWRDIDAENMRSWDPTRLARVFRGSTVADLPTRQAVASIEVPTLILAWTGDPAHPTTTAEELSGLISTSELSVASTAEELAQWTDQVDSFVKSVL